MCLRNEVKNEKIQTSMYPYMYDVFFISRL